MLPQHLRVTFTTMEGEVLITRELNCAGRGGVSSAFCRFLGGLFEQACRIIAARKKEGRDVEGQHD
jgi:hypothetical protein